MKLIDRVVAILTRPQATWDEIESEPGDVATIYREYLLILAAVPAVAGFIGLSLIGVGGFGSTYRQPLFSGLVNMVVGYALTLAVIYVVALIADALAPTFGGQKNLVNAVKLVGYASTAGLVGGVFSLIPALSMLGLLAALYSIYLLYTGITVMMKVAHEKALPYTAVLVVCGIVASVVLGAVGAIFR